MQQVSPRAKGPPVWLDMDQQALDDAYDQEVYAPNRALVVARRHAASERAGAPRSGRWGSGRRSVRYFASSASPLAISAPETVRLNVSSLMPWWKRLPMKRPTSIDGSRIAVAIITSRVNSPTA